MSGDATSQQIASEQATDATEAYHPIDTTATEADETPVLPPRIDSRLEASIEHGNDHPAQQRGEHPQVAMLRGMFPDFDVVILQSVLESVDYDQDRAIDVLLGMSDPEYVSTTAQAPAHDLALDEQLARQLALEDRQERPRHASGQSWPRRDDEYRLQGRQGAQQQQQYVTGSERGDFQDFQETLGKMAESGKRTFSSIVSKAKAKIGELNDQYNQQRSNQPSSGQTSQWVPVAPTNVDRHAASQAVAQQYYGSYYDDPGDAQPPPIALHDKQSQPNSEVRGYDIGSGDATSSPPATPRRASSPPVAGRISLSSSRPSGEIPRPPPTSIGSPIDAAKLGLLPKRPVSLLPPQQATMQRQPSEDELEYVENPFEEGEGRH